MQAFDYVRPTTVDEAVSILARHGDQARVLSGGTDLIVALRESRRQVQVVVDIKALSETAELAYSPQAGLRLGAAVPCYRIYGDSAVAAAYPGLIDAARLIGGIQIQGRASIGGNICNASPAADSAPALIVHAATCVIAGPHGRREVAVEDFFAGPGRTVLQPGEFLVSIRLPAPEPGFGAAYLRFTPRNEMDIAVVGAGASVVLDETRRTIRSARIALGAVAPTPLLVAAAGNALAGLPADDAAVEQAAALAEEAARPITDMRGTAEFRKHLSAVLTRRTLRAAIARAQAA
ncbi:MAG: xanthine dehydrogenase family protein subunit M [Chloroflexota bacterium]|nr:xanthine dehydrogenase family protein subunit M [Chloroflexota bacterium]